VRSLKNLRGMASILVEQHTGVALELTEDAVVIERVAIAHRAKSADFARDAQTLERYVGLKVS
jgi:branched-chain amino acid transport system ATP-binding protein